MSDTGLDMHSKVAISVIVCTISICMMIGYIYDRSCTFSQEMAKNGYEERQLSVSMPSQKTWVKIATPVESK